MALMRGPYCTGAPTPSGKAARVRAPHCPHTQACARCSVASRGCGSGRSNTCRRTGSPRLVGRRQLRAAVPALAGPVVGDMVRRRRAAQGVPLVARLPAGPLAAAPAQTARALRRGRGLAQAVGRGRLAGVAAVEVRAPLQLLHPLAQSRVFLAGRPQERLALRQLRLALRQLRVAIREIRSVLLLQGGELLPQLRQLAFQLTEPRSSTAHRSGLALGRLRHRSVTSPSRSNI